MPFFLMCNIWFLKQKRWWMETLPNFGVFFFNCFLLLSLINHRYSSLLLLCKILEMNLLVWLFNSQCIHTAFSSTFNDAARQMCSLHRMLNCWKYFFSVTHILKCSKFSVLSWILESNSWSRSPSLQVWCCSWHRCWTALHDRVDRQFGGKRFAMSEIKIDNNWNMAMLA